MPQCPKQCRAPGTSLSRAPVLSRALSTNATFACFTQKHGPSCHLALPVPYRFGCWLPRILPRIKNNPDVAPRRVLARAPRAPVGFYNVLVTNFYSSGESGRQGRDGGVRLCFCKGGCWYIPLGDLSRVSRKANLPTMM